MIDQYSKPENQCHLSENDEIQLCDRMNNKEKLNKKCQVYEQADIAVKKRGKICPKTFINAAQKMYENGQYKQDRELKEFFVKKNVKLKNFEKSENIPKFINPISFIRLLDHFLPLDYNNKGHTFTQFYTRYKRMTQLDYDTIEKEWIYHFEEKDLNYCFLEEFAPRIGYFTEWLTSLGNKLAFELSAMIQRYLIKYSNVSKAYIESIDINERLCKIPSNQRTYVMKLPDDVWANIKERPYLRKITCYDKEKLRGHCVSWILNEALSKKIQFVPCLNDGYMGFRFFNFVLMKNWQQFYSRTIAAAVNCDMIKIPENVIEIIDVNGNEVFKKEVEIYRELYVENGLFYCSSIQVFNE